MQALPSLVGTGTVIAAAAAGLVIGQVSGDEAPRPSPHKSTSKYGSLRTKSLPRPSTHPVKNPQPAEEFRQFSDPTGGPLTSHPTTEFSCSSGVPGSQLMPPRAESRRLSLIPTNDASIRPITENGRDSTRSRDSWIKRLSIRPLSQHDSPRSSMAVDSTSLAFSFGSAAPMVGPAPDQPVQPNKLVKRGTTGEKDGMGWTMPMGSKLNMHSLRRPATSHQRSRTLQQFAAQGGFSPPPTSPPPTVSKFSFDCSRSPEEAGAETAIQSPAVGPKEKPGWTSLFRSENVKLSGRVSLGRQREGSPLSHVGSGQRVYLRPGLMPPSYLTKADGPHKPQSPEECLAESNSPAGAKQSPREPCKTPQSTDTTPSKRTTRSLSMRLSSASSWISRTGSIRRAKRGSTHANTKGGGKRHVSEPVGSVPKTNQRETKASVQEIFSVAQETSSDVANNLASICTRNASSALPPVACVSSMNLDFRQLGLSSSSSRRPRSNPNTPGATLGGHSFGAFPRAVSGERCSIPVSSDMEARDGMSVDDEDTDYTKFDSIRTTASMSSSQQIRNVETPLESTFEDSPPSTAENNGRTKRFPIQGVLGAWGNGTRITEEDESLPTPIRATHVGDPVEFGGVQLGMEDAPADLAFIAKHIARLSLDDDDDDGWARFDDNALTNHLSPPSSDVNSRGVSPPLRHKLASISGHASPESRHPESFTERPRSNIFDWSEPSTHDRLDLGNHSPRPKTVHGKQEMDLRGGRPANRKGPTATHVRSRSVPAVPETVDSVKTASAKFGTWNLGSKTASEDWDDDFEFEEASQGAVGGVEIAPHAFVTIPASIQAKQPTVKAHSGQIRELSLLVNDLKRLCRHGRDLDLIGGSASSKFKEAEDIIALASPDDEGNEEGLADSGHADVEDGFLDERFDGSAFEQVQGPLDFTKAETTKMAVVREKAMNRRHSVLSLDDDIFGGGGSVADDNTRSSRPRTPELVHSRQDSAGIATVIEAMQLQKATTPGRDASPSKPSNSKLFFDTNSLQELVKRAGQLRDALSDAVRGAELLTQSPAGTPRRERTARHNADGSPAFTRVFAEPAASPPKRLIKSHSTNSVLSRASIDSPRRQMMAVQ